MKIPTLIIKITRLLPWIVVIILASILFLRRFPIDGVRILEFPLDGNSLWFDAFLPAERVTAPGLQPEGWTGQRITQNPVYAGIRIPGAYDSFTVEFEVKPTRQPLLELGVLRDAKNSIYEMQPLWSEQLNQGWHEVDLQDLHGFVRDGLSDSVLTSANNKTRLSWFASQTSSTASSLRRMTETDDLQKEGIEAVVTPYALPQIIPDGWLKLKASFNLVAPGEKVKISLSAPGVHDRQGTVDIRNVKITFNRQALTSWSKCWLYLHRELSAAWHRL